jgi:hypothetical protein
MDSPLASRRAFIHRPPAANCTAAVYQRELLNSRLTSSFLSRHSVLVTRYKSSASSDQLSVPPPSPPLHMRPVVLLLPLLLLPLSSYSQLLPFKMLEFSILQKMRFPSAVVTLDLSFTSPVVHPAGAAFTLAYPSPAPAPPPPPPPRNLFHSPPPPPPPLSLTLFPNCSFSLSPPRPWSAYPLFPLTSTAPLPPQQTPPPHHPCPSPSPPTPSPPPVTSTFASTV